MPVLGFCGMHTYGIPHALNKQIKSEAIININQREMCWPPFRPSCGRTQRPACVSRMNPGRLDLSKTNDKWQI